MFLAFAMAFFCDFVSAGTASWSSGKSMSFSLSLSSLPKPARSAAVWSSSTASSTSPSSVTIASTSAGSSAGSSCCFLLVLAFFDFLLVVSSATGSSTGAGAASAALPFFAFVALAFGASFFGVSFFASITSKSSIDSSSPLASGTGSAFFLPLVGLVVLAGASSSEKKSSACLRADFFAGFSAAGAGALLAALGDLAGLLGAAMSSDFLGFFALGAASEAPSNGEQ